MILLVDCGNTSSKWRLLDDKGALIAERRESDSSFALLKLELAAAQIKSKALGVFLASVANASVRRELNAALCSVSDFSFSLTDVKVQADFCGLKIAYDDISQLGVDRWLAMLAAYCKKQTSVLLVSLGTAVTVDKVSDSGRHLGGMIAPGWGLLKGSLAEGTANLAQARNIKLVASDELGKDTLGCLQSGVSIMMLNFVSSVAAQFGADVSCKILTGGDASEMDQCLDLGFTVKENLVLDGLQIYCFQGGLRPV